MTRPFFFAIRNWSESRTKQTQISKPTFKIHGNQSNLLAETEMNIRCRWSWQLILCIGKRKRRISGGCKKQRTSFNALQEDLALWKCVLSLSLTVAASVLFVVWWGRWEGPFYFLWLRRYSRLTRTVPHKHLCYFLLVFFNNYLTTELFFYSIQRVGLNFILIG